jgi:hypothetical protein
LAKVNECQYCKRTVLNSPWHENCRKAAERGELKKFLRENTKAEQKAHLSELIDMTQRALSQPPTRPSDKMIR